MGRRAETRAERREPSGPAQAQMAGTAGAIVPAHAKILKLRSSAGVSMQTLLLTNLQQSFGLSWRMG